MKIWCSKDFTGHQPVGTAAIVVAPDYNQAIALIIAELKTAGLKWDGTLKEVQLENPHVIILNDGDY